MSRCRPFRSHLSAVALVVLLATACASAPAAPAAPVAPPGLPPLSLDQKVGWILRLEQQRSLRDPDVVRATDTSQAPLALTSARVADLEALVRDTDAPVRARAALAIGRIGDSGGLGALTRALADPDPDVRASAAFAMGLLGVKSAAPMLIGALKDPSVMVRVRVIDGLGLLADPASASAIVEAATGCVGLIAPIEADDEQWPKAPEIEVCRSSLFALVRLGSYDGIASIALDPSGRPVSRWWPVAFALQKANDRRAAPALLSLVSSTGVYTPGFALRGLTALKDPAVLPLAGAIAARRDLDIKLRVAAVRTMGQVGGAAALAPLVALLAEPALPTNMTVEVASALGVVGDRRAFDPLVDLVTDPSPTVRAAALAAAAKVDPESFLLVLSGLGRDPDWRVRAALAPVLGTLPIDRVRGALEELAEDQDARLHGPALAGLAAAHDPRLPARLLTALTASDFGERSAAAELLGELKPAGGVAALAAAYARGESDVAFEARASALEALAKYGGDDALVTLRRGLADREWPVRWRAAELLRGLGQRDAVPAVPAPTHQSVEFFSSSALLHPAYSPHAFIETKYGSIEVQLNVVDAGVASLTFVEQARSGLFNGMPIHRVVPAFVLQAGDPRGDGEGGPGYSVRDEISVLPYLRGTVGLALNWRDTAGSQWFITVAPQPHLDAKYTVIGRVVNGWEALDRLTAGDVIDRVRIWDGVDFK